MIGGNNSERLNGWKYSERIEYLLGIYISTKQSNRVECRNYFQQLFKMSKLLLKG